ncbi:hypothetical protein HK104_003117, partial [Borealophlyctis nickersoniae]
MSSLSPITQIFPLVIVVVFAAAKEAIEDYARYKADRAANSQPCTVIRQGRKQEIISMNLQPGDILYVEKEDKCPVDAVIISTSYEDGTCFVETAELDGETNLKRRSAVPELSGLTTVESVSRLRGHINCEQPNENLNSFEGAVHIDTSRLSSPHLAPAHHASAPTAQILPLTMSNLLLRGAVLRNTDFAYALVIYTGSNTKIIRNLKRSKIKSSTLERKLNWLVCGAFVYNAALLISSVVLEWVHYRRVWGEEQERKKTVPDDYAVEWYLGVKDSSGGRHVGQTVVSFFVLYTYVIPISLFVTMELVRLCQAKFMMWDAQMRVEVPDPVRPGQTVKLKMKANNSNLNEDLGCVDYIFSDKTGTLTQNDMRLAAWYVEGRVLEEMKEPGIFERRLKDPDTPPETRETMTLFGRALSLCHSVIPSIDEKTNTTIYESQSPDETALLHGISQAGFKLLSRSKNHTTVNVLGTVEKTPVLQTLEFSSDRKRMSVIVRTESGELHLYCKGADNIIMARLSPSPEHNPPEMSAKTEEALHHFAEEGLRTLMIAWRPLGEEEYEAFRVAYAEAERSVGDRERKVAEVCERVERDLRVLGCTAIEDRLQDEVPETIEYLLQCDVHIWLLTGDKMETAINIGNSSRLIGPDMHVIILKSKTEKEVVADMERIIKEMDERKDGRRNALVVNGDTLTHIFANHPHHFLTIGTRCHSVICCRVTPLQKALVVKLVQNSLKCVTLAIGDGANDVSMIQAANIGVGIMGREGAQAVRAADYAFGEFRFLRRLMAVHGRYSYMRMSGLIFYSFYKNLTFITVQWWYGFMSAWSGQAVYEEVFLTAFNVVFTSLPPLIYAIFERDVTETRINAYPQLYRQVQRGQYWSPLLIFTTLLSSLWHSFAIFGSVWLVHHEGAVDTNGRSTGYWVQCYLFSTPILITVLLKSAVGTRLWVWPTWVVILASLCLNVVAMFVVEVFKFVEKGTSEIGHALPAYYL